jgi:hypothetical protein
MANTTNYNWETPDDTDLVKDGAAAIRTLGSSIDTTTKNLNPQTTTGAIAYRSATANVNTALPIGTAGQILAVSGGVPAWINNDQGDITEVQAGTGISVASGTGPIPVITNTVATAFDAAGDLVYGTGADTFTKLALGTAGQVLKVNAGATAPEWGAAAGGGFVGASIYNSASQSISNTTWTTLNFNSESFDTDTFHDTATNNSRITIPSGKNGKYLIVAKWHLQGNASGSDRLGGIKKNGTNIGTYRGINGNASSVGWGASVILDLVATDYIELEVYQDSGGNLNALGGFAAPEYNFLQVQFLGA